MQTLTPNSPENNGVVWLMDGACSNRGTLLTETANKDRLSVCLSVSLSLCVFDCLWVCVMSSRCAPGNLIMCRQ